MNRIEANLLATDLKFAVVSTRWNHLIVDRLVEGAELAFAQHANEGRSWFAWLGDQGRDDPRVACISTKSWKAFKESV